MGGRHDRMRRPAPGCDPSFRQKADPLGLPRLLSGTVRNRPRPPHRDAIEAADLRAHCTKGASRADNRWRDAMTIAMVEWAVRAPKPSMPAGGRRAKGRAPPLRPSERGSRGRVSPLPEGTRSSARPEAAALGNPLRPHQPRGGALKRGHRPRHGPLRSGTCGGVPGLIASRGNWCGGKRPGRAENAVPRED